MAAPKNLLEHALRWEKLAPERVYLTQPLGGGADNVRDYTFKAVVTEARRMAAYIKGLGLPDHSQIAICSKNCAHWIMADLAIWMAGHASVPLYPTLTQETVEYTLTHSESRLLFVGKLDSVWYEMNKGVPDGISKIAMPLAPATDYPKWEDIVASSEPLTDVADRAPGEMATIIYTSGSTGVPKGAMHCFGAMLTATRGIVEHVNMNPGDRMLSYLPLAHGMERWLGECASLYSGPRVFFAESIDTFVRDLQRARPTLFLSVPRLWLKFQLGVFEKMPPQKLERLLRIPILSGVIKKKILKGLGLDAVRFAGSGSAPIPKELLDWYRRLGLELLEGYGMTENFNYSHVTKPGEVRVGYVGATYEDTDCKIGDGGEILVKSPGTMMGYFKMPDESQACFTEDGYLKTGDCGEIDDLGRLRITGRIKEIFKTSKGKYVAPAPIENMIVNHPRIEQCCVGGAGYPQPHVIVQLSEDAAKDAAGAGRARIEAELAEHLQRINQSLETYERLEFISITKDAWSPENGFLTPTLKIKRAKIEAAYGGFSDDWYATHEPVVWQA